MTIWDPRNETMSRDDLGQLQLERLQATLHRVQRSVAFYRRRFDECGFDPDALRSLEDLRRLPFTTRAELAEHHPYGLFAVPLREVVRLHASTSADGARCRRDTTHIRTWGAGRAGPRHGGITRVTSSGRLRLRHLPDSF
jgi:phenylacetate-CoA ligase